MEFLTTTLISSIVGLFVGLTYNKFETSYTKSSRQELAKSQLAKSYRFNLVLVDKMIKQLKNDPPEAIPNYLFDTDPIKQVIFYSEDLLGTIEEVYSYNWHRYQLDHLNIKLTYILGTLAHHACQKEIVQDFRENLAREQKAIQDILSKLKTAKSQ